MGDADSSVGYSFRGLAGALVCGAGAGLAGYSVLVKLAAVPCFSASCGAVINSEYGDLFGFPVGLIGLVLWGAFPWVPRVGQLGLKVALVVGSIIFILIQAFLLKQFCPICLAHAAACFLVAALPIPGRLTSATVFLGLGLALAAAVGADAWNRRQLLDRIGERGSGPAEVVSPGRIPGLPWLGSEELEDVRLVVSLSCGQCQRILEDLLSGGAFDRPTAPLLFLSEDGNEEVTRVALAAVLSVPESARPDGFARVLGILLVDPSILARDDGETAGFLLSAEFPGLEAHLAEAADLLAAHAEILHRLGIVGTPALVVGGRPAAFERSLVAGDRL
ncbi:MAG: vitamin K epoxide reductase family protein [Opitutaceae bacterium]